MSRFSPYQSICICCQTFCSTAQHGCSAADVIGPALRRHPFSSGIRIRIVLSGIKGGTRNASQSVELESVTVCAVQSVQIDVIYM